MTAPSSTRLLSIGEFSAATQLSPKALRIYDEQRLLVPARTDPATGYRLYRNDQVSLGRLIRTLREMGLSLAAIANVVSSKSGGAELLLAELVRELDNRYACERRAYHSALLLLRESHRAQGPAIIERTREATTAVLRPFMANRYEFVEKFHAQAQAIRECVLEAGLTLRDEASCALVDPLCDDEGRLEVVMPIEVPDRIPNGLTLRRLPAASCAVVISNARHSHASDLAGALDALFDWFDRHTCRAIEAPLVRIEAGRAGLRTEVVWAFERTSV